MPVKNPITFVLFGPVFTCVLIGSLSSIGMCSSLDVQFEFDQSVFVAGPEDVIRLDVTLTNLASSMTNLSGSQLESIQIMGGNLVGQNGPYTMDFGPLGNETNFQFLKDNIHLEPGDSFSFVFGYLVPWSNNPIVPSGDYVSGTANIEFDGIHYPTSRVLEVTVVPVPEPFALLLLAIVGVAWAMLGRDVRPSKNPPPPSMPPA